MTDDDRGAGEAPEDSIEERVWRSVTTLKRPGRDARPVTFGDLAPIFDELRRLAFVIEGERRPNLDIVISPLAIDEAAMSAFVEPSK